jgi:hypothetical protein
MSCLYTAVGCVPHERTLLVRIIRKTGMKNLAKQLTLFFSAGCLGALANSLALWLFGALGITAAVGARISPTLTPEWLYPRIVWGGLWGFLFLIPNLPTRPLTKR